MSNFLGQHLHRAWGSSTIKWQEENSEKDQSAQWCAVEGMAVRMKNNTDLYNNNNCARTHCIY